MQNIILVTFDMETDIGSWTREDRGVREGTPEILKVLSNHGVKCTFLFTGREAINNLGIVQRILSDGHEIGCHTMYHETIGNAIFDMPGENFILDAEIQERLRLATSTIQQASGVQPVSFRAPRLFGSTAMISALDDLGYVADASFPSYYYSRDFLPYRPSSEDWSREGDLRILEIPNFYDADADESTDDRSRDQWPILRLKGAESFSDLSRRMLNKVKDEKGRSVLCIYLHPWEFVNMPQTISTSEVDITFKPFLHQNCGEFAIRALDQYLDAMRRDGAAFTTMRELAAGW